MIKGLMDCREFRKNHAPFVDAQCGAAEEQQMREHVSACPSCARQDMLIRRSLMLMRNLPRIEPSPDFQARLNARLRAATAAATDSRRPLRFSVGAFAAIAASIAFVTVAASLSVRHAQPREIRLDPVVASLPELESAPSPVATPALVATVPTGMPVWPGIMVATQAPMHFVAAELASER
jgi:anti-sigma factor RsiW